MGKDNELEITKGKGGKGVAKKQIHLLHPEKNQRNHFYELHGRATRARVRSCAETGATAVEGE